ncbi:hypothetical protein J4O73_23755 [Methylobacterium sp. NFXW15]
MRNSAVGTRRVITACRTSTLFRPRPSHPEEVIALCERIGLTAAPYMGGSNRLIIRDADKHKIVPCTEALDGTMHVAQWEVRLALRTLANRRHEAAFPE